MHWKTLLIGVLAGLTLWGKAHGESWNATNQFGTQNGNPNGVWSYGWFSPSFDQFHLLDHARRGGYPGWETFINGKPNPSISVNATGGVGYGIPPGWLSLHPGPNEEPVCLRWTAPYTIPGCTQVTGQFLPGDLGVPQVAIRHNGVTVWSSVDSGAFNVCLEIASGDTVDFLAFDAYGAGNTPVSVTISDPGDASNLVTNGDFESCALTGCNTSSCSQSCDFLLPSWTKGPSFISVDLFRNLPTGCTPYLPTGGLLRLSLQGSVCCECNNNGWISQGVPLTLNAGYRLELDVLMDELDALRVSCGGASFDLIPSLEYPPNEWVHVTWEFECVDPSAPLRLESIGVLNGPNCMSADLVEIDNITLHPAEVVCHRLVPAQYSTIQSAIDSVPNQRPCVIEVAAGLFTGPIDFHGKDVLVKGAGAGLTIIAGTGGAQRSVVAFSGGEPATAGIEDLTIMGGLTGTPLPNLPSVLVGGGVFMNATAGYLRRCTIQDNAGGFGGGLYALQSAALIEDCTFQNNTSAADGGGVQIYGGAVTVRNSLVAGNTAVSRGGGMHLVEGKPVLQGVEIRNNSCASIGGGVTWAPVGVSIALLTLDECAITNNDAAFSYGGLVTLQGSAQPTVSVLNTSVCGNVPAPQVGGTWTDAGGNSICDCIGDLTLNGSVDGSDLGLLLGYWGPANANGAGDFNHDGMVDGTDLGLLLANWGVCVN